MQLLTLFKDFIGNYVMLAALSSWGLAQVSKFFIAWFTEGRPNIHRLFGDGGMPSAHSATVAAMTIMVGYACGYASPAFGLSLVMAIIVMHDATGVRRETGKQAAMLLELTDIVAMLSGVISEKDDIVRRQKLKTMVGHTPLQVICGAMFGICVAFFFILLFGPTYCQYA